MTLLLHAGPMKTGTTAIQDLLACNTAVLAERGIRFQWLRRDYLDHLEAVLASDPPAAGELLVVSHECLCRAPSARLRTLLSALSCPIHALLVARPLRELYPSLYLQNLKGHVMRCSSFEAFLEEQIERDRAPELAQRGQLFCFAHLDAVLREAGCDVHWVRYSRSDLLRQVVFFMAQLAGQSIDLDDLHPAPAPQGANPRRSLDHAVADAARTINRHCREGALSPDGRQQLLGSLLDFSDQIRALRSGADPFPALHREHLDALDRELNGRFWAEQTFVA